MGHFVEEGFERLCCNRADGYLPATLRVTLNIAVQLLELLTSDVERRKRSLLVPLRNILRLVFSALGLS